MDVDPGPPAGPAEESSAAWPADPSTDLGAAEGVPARRRRDQTLATIGRLAGVSPSTVSKVLNGHPGVAVQTRRRVEAALREQGYRRPRVTDPTATIEVVFHGLFGDLSTQILDGVERVARRCELAVGVTNARNAVADARSWSELLLARRPRGVIVVHSHLTPEQHGRLATSALPVVAVDPMGEPMQDVPSVGATNWSGGVSAARHLLDLGHERIGVISGPAEFLCARARLEAARAVLDTGGRPLDNRLVRTGRFVFDEGLRLGEELLGLPDRPTAVLCGNDLQALGVYEAARRRGLAIPQDLSVVGFDDVPVARCCPPPLTTVRQPFRQMGEVAAELLVSLTRGVTPAHTRVEIATELVVRASTVPPAR